MVKFSAANTKLKKLYKVAALAKWLDGGRKIYSFDLLSGWACPQADKCMSRAILVDGKRKIQDGPNTEFRCFSASQEVVYTNVYNLRKANFDAIRAIVADSTLSEDDKIYAIAQLIQSTLPKNAGIIRIHVAGDFFNKLYFRAWLEVATNNSSQAVVVGLTQKLTNINCGKQLYCKMKVRLTILIWKSITTIPTPLSLTAVISRSP